jgi:type II secretory pathway pseudopilin PulG
VTSALVRRLTPVRLRSAGETARCPQTSSTGPLIRTCRSGFASTAGFVITELLTVLLILTIVLGGLTALFVSATQSEVDLRKRFEAQQEARIAMDALRREVHCASAVDQTGTSHRVRLTLATGCPSGSGTITWCTVSAGTNRYQLYRKAGTTCDATGKLYADYLLADPSGSNPTTECTTPTSPAKLCVFEYFPATSTTRAKLGVELPVDSDPADSRQAYKLIDALVLRNSSFL